jgi:glyoxylate/hydroxypyruvate reductase A
MKNIICIIGNFIPEERKKQIISALKDHALNLKLPFNFDLLSLTMAPNQYIDNYQYAITCFPPAGILSHFTSLEFVLSLNIGVDGIAEEINARTHLSRIIHQPAITRISQYTVYCVLDFILLMDKYREGQLSSAWNRTKPLSNINNQIGVMGLGNVGSKIVSILKIIGQDVYGYSTSEKPSLKHSFTADQLEPFLSKINILINSLPLNSSTRGILNKKTLSYLPDHSCIINIGRGDHINENELLEALDSDKLKKVYLDVFSCEPLPIDHPFWSHKKIFLTPHISGVFDVLDVLSTAVEQIKLFNEQGIVINEIKHNLPSEDCRPYF